MDEGSIPSSSTKMFRCQEYHPREGSSLSEASKLERNSLQLHNKMIEYSPLKQWAICFKRMVPTMIEIRKATREQATEIARLIMTAMTDDCCLFFCGEGYGLDDFHKMMTRLVEREDSQYSYLNTLVALDADRVVGVSVSYDGGLLHQLRQAFIDSAKVYIGKDHSGMDDETQAGELYLDSLAVVPEYRRQGIARRLILATKERANHMGLPCVGLLVDQGNPAGEALYSALGFRFVNESTWGGHPMKHLTL